MTVKLLTEQHFEFLRLKGGYTGSPESTLVKMPSVSIPKIATWKSHVTEDDVRNARTSSFFPLQDWKKRLQSIQMTAITDSRQKNVNNVAKRRQPEETLPTFCDVVSLSYRREIRHL